VASPDDVVGRLDKYTFGILAHGVCDLDTAMPVIARIKRGYAEPFDIGPGKLELEGRFGLALGPRPDVSSEDFLRHAEMALDSATGGGVRVFRPSVLARAKSRAVVEADLRQALHTDELVAFYQPIVRTQTGIIEGFEALVRWRKPDGRLIAPLAFIPIAEESGLIQKLDALVLKQACEFAKRLGKLTGHQPFVNVNLSAEHFSHTALPDVVRSVLSEVGLPGSALKLEVTETALLENAELAICVMQELRKHGVRFGLDDFGTGYSSLSYLHRFPFETLKIDRSFIQALGSQEKRPELAAAIILLARSMSLVAVAEGVETTTQLDFLRPLQCSFAQGFLFSPAVPADAAERLFATQPFAM
jgi:EAL domain-containing protein (putative c-di-GMP-specific phosphodiesterase class I)